jgi:hypothetical protein
MNKLQMIKKIARLKLAELDFDFDSTNWVYTQLNSSFRSTPFKNLHGTRQDDKEIIVRAMIEDFEKLNVLFLIPIDNFNNSFTLKVFDRDTGFKFENRIFGNDNISSTTENLQNAYEEVIKEYNSFWYEKYRNRKS